MFYMDQLHSDKALAGRIGGYTTASRHDSRAITAAARAAFLASFAEQVDPDRLLTEAERARRADAAKRLYFARLAMKSAAVRRKAAGMTP